MMPKSGIWKLAAPCLMIVAAAWATFSFAGADVADIVLGQGNFTSNTANPPDAHKLFSPQGVAIDASSSPTHLYVADTQNNRVLGWNDVAELASGAPAPADLVIGQPDFDSNAPNINGITGIASAGSLYNPIGVAVDPSGNLYVADYINNRVLEYNSPFTGCGSLPCVGGAANLVYGQEDSFTSTTANKGGVSGGPTANSLSGPYGVAVDADGHLYVADYKNNRVLEYNSPLADTTANLVLGQGGSFTSDAPNNGGVSASSLYQPGAVAVDASGDLYVADSGNARALEYNVPLSNAASANMVFGQADSNSSGCNTASASSLCLPFAVAVDKYGDLYVADEDYNRVLEYNAPLTSGASASLVLGQYVSGEPSFSSHSCNDGIAGLGADSLCGPWGVAVDAATGDLYVADEGDNRVLEYTAPLASGADANYVLGQPDFSQNRDNFRDQYSLYNPYAVAIDTSASPNRLYVADEYNSRVLGWSDVATFVNGSPADLVIGQPNFYSTTCDYDTTDAPFNGATPIDLCYPYGVAVDDAGNLYVADIGNSRVLEYNAPVTSGATAKMVFGQGSSANDFTSNGCYDGTAEGDVDGVGADSLCDPSGVALDSTSNLYVADSRNNRVLEYNAPLTSGASANLVFGQDGSFTSTGCNDGTAPADVSGLGADSLCNPIGVALDSTSNLYVADYSNNRVLEYTNPLSNTTANLVFGQGSFTSNALYDAGASASASSLNNPSGVALDASGNLYVADTSNNRTLEYNATLTSGASANRVFGQDGSFTTNTANTGGVSASSLNNPSGVALDASGSLYVADTYNNRVLEYQSPLAAIPTSTSTATPTATPTTSMTVTASLNFGKVVIGQTVAEALKVANTGKTHSLVISSVTSTDSQYVVTGAGTCGAIPVTVAPRTACLMGVSFTPNAVALPGATLTLTDNGGTGSQNVSLSGTGLVDLAISKSSLVYLSVKFGASSVKAFSVTNRQAQPVTLSETLSGTNHADFSIGGSCTSTLAASSTCTTSVTFTPGALGTESATLTVSDSPDPISPYTVGLITGTTVPPAVSPLTIAYGTLPKTVSSKIKDVTVKNISGSVTASISGPNALDFVAGGGCNGVLPPTPACAIAVTFTPTGGGSQESATMKVNIAGDPNSPHSVSLTGAAH